ncbi:MAG: hypothetical protein ABSG81_14725 [Acidimicrobiales bacterium]
MTEPLVPSYLKKLARAEKHLADLKAEFGRFADRHPYTLAITVQRQRNLYRLEFTESPENTDIPIIAADVIYNIRSGLDHLAAALVPAKRRDSTMFPIFWQGVWNDPVPGENEQRAKDRSRWESYTRDMRPEAVAHLKRMQPRVRGDNEEAVSFLRAINQLSNTDRHTKLPLIATALKNVRITWSGPDGTPRQGHDPRTDDPVVGVNNGAAIDGIPDDATNVQILGTPAIVVRVTKPAAELELVPTLEGALPVIREQGVMPLLPFVHVPPANRTGRV